MAKKFHRAPLFHMDESGGILHKIGEEAFLQGNELPKNATLPIMAGGLCPVLTSTSSSSLGLTIGRVLMSLKFATRFAFSVTLATALFYTAMPADAQMQLRGRVSTAMRQANQQFQVGNLEKAESIYMQAVRRNPRSAQYRSALSLVQAELYKLNVAEDNAKQALKLDPKNPYAHIALGMVYRNRTASSDMEYRLQRDTLLEQAANEFQTALRYDPHNADAQNRLGETYRMQGKLGEAQDAFEAALDLDPRYSDAHANLGTVLKAKGQSQAAIDHYKQAIKLNSKNYKAHYYLGEALTDLGQYHAALESFNTALSQKRDSAMVHTKMGEALEKQGNEAAAIAHYRQAIQSKPEYFPAYQHLANVFDYRGDEELAISELKSGLNANPNALPLKNQVGWLSLKADKPDQAVLFYREVLKSDPTNAEALDGIAQAYTVVAQRLAAQGTFQGADAYVDAQEAIEEALRAQPNNISLHLAMLRIEKLAGKPTEAREHLEKIVATTPQTDIEKLAVGEALFTLGRYQESDKLFSDLLQSYHGNVRSTLTLADTALVNGDLDMARKAYQKIQAQDPKNRKASWGLQRVSMLEEGANKNYRLADSLNNWMSKKQRRSAKDFYREAVSQYPRMPEARLALAKIYSGEKNYGEAIFEYQAYLELSPELEARERERIEHRIDQLQKSLENSQKTANAQSKG